MSSSATAGETGETAAETTMPDSVDPRVVASRRVICVAALIEFANHGFDGMTIEGVAARAGVGKSTIYRHWNSRADLVESAFGTMPVFTAQTEGHGDALRSRVVRHLLEVESTLHSEPWSRVLPAMIHASERFSEVRAIQDRFVSERRAVLRAILAHGVEMGELAEGTDLDVLGRTLAGPLFLSRLMLNERVGRTMIERIVDSVLP